MLKDNIEKLHVQIRESKRGKMDVKGCLGFLGYFFSQQKCIVTRPWKVIKFLFFLLQILCVIKKTRRQGGRKPHRKHVRRKLRVAWHPEVQ